MKGHLAIYVPHVIWYSDKLTTTEKLLLGRIYYFTLEGFAGACLESNDTLADYLQVTVDTIKRSLHKLEKGDWIHRDIVNNNKRRITLSKNVKAYFTPPTECMS